MTAFALTVCRSGLDSGIESILALFQVFLQTLVIFLPLYNFHGVKCLQLFHSCS